MVMSETKTFCYHCGDPCFDLPIVWDQKNFCCDGCKTVYQILNENELCDFYSIENQPGLKIKTTESGSFAYLDHEEVIKKIVDFRDDGLVKVTLFIPKIHCNSCLWLLEKLHKLNSGINRSEVNFIKKEVSVTFREQEISLRQLVELLDSIGYTPFLQSDKKEVRTDNRLVYQVGVAGFCFGNIMLLSFPEYFGLTAYEKSFTTLFGYLNLILSIPVLTFCSIDYFKSAWYGIKHRTINLDIPISIGILVLFFRSTWELLTHFGPGYFDSLAGLLFFLLIGKWYQSKTYKAISFERDYHSYFPAAVTKIEGNTETSVLLKDIKPGDVLLIRNQEIIPADALLLESDASIDYSFVTGEAMPVHKKKKDLIYAGGRQCGKSITIQVLKDVSQSYLLQLWNNDIKDKTNDYPEIGDTAKLLSKRFFYLLSFISICTLVFWLWKDSSQAAIVITSVLIVACPCALALTIPFTFGNTLRHLGKQGLFLKNAKSVEKVAHCTSLVFDKTGTLTQTSASNTEYIGIALSTEEYSALKTAVKQSTHPVCLAIQKKLHDTHATTLISFEEIPSKGLRCETEGYHITLGSASFIEIEEAADINKDAPRSYLQINGVYKGVFLMHATYRKNIARVFSTLQPKYKLNLLSGDQARDTEKLSPWFGGDKNLHFNQSPTDKLAFIKSLQTTGEKVLMMGDGLNDAGALKESHAGIAISEDVYHFSPACEGVLNAGDFEKIPAMLSLSKDAIRVVKMSYFVSFSYNAVGLAFAVSGNLTPLIAAVLMPVSSVSVVLFTTVATHYYAGRRFN